MCDDITPGYVFLPRAIGAHPWVIISSPRPAINGNVLAVNITELRQSCIDDACILEPGDHQLIRKKSTVAYSRARLWPAKRIHFGILQKALSELPRLSPSILEKIIAGARNSPELRREWKSLL
jgi:hypothetical protein